MCVLCVWANVAPSCSYSNCPTKARDRSIIDHDRSAAKWQAVRSQHNSFDTPSTPMKHSVGGAYTIHRDHRYRRAGSPYLAARAVDSEATVVAPGDKRLLPFPCTGHRAHPIRLMRTTEKGHGTRRAEGGHGSIHQKRTPSV